MSRLLHIEAAAEAAGMPSYVLAALCGHGRIGHHHTPDGLHIESDSLESWLTEADLDDDDGIDWAALALVAVIVVIGAASAAAGYWIGS